MENSKEIILGGGISGLIWAYFNPKSILVSDQIGGQLSSAFQLGPKYLHVDKYSKRFLNELDVKLKIKKIKIGFFYDGKCHSENTKENRKKYFQKTRGEIKMPYTSVMSSNKTEFESFDIDANEIIEKIKEKIYNEIILERIMKIDLENKKILTEAKKIEYVNLVSTIPLNIFLLLAGKLELAKQYRSFPTTFVYRHADDECPFKDFEDFDYVYVSELKYPFHRITKVPNGFVFEYKGDNIIASSNEVDRVVMKTGQLIENDSKIDFEDVKFFGRYSCWRHNLKTNDLLKEIYDE